MSDKSREFTREFFSGIQQMAVYPSGHPRLNEIIEKVYSLLTEIISGRKRVIIGIVGEEVVFEKEIFFELSRIFKGIIKSFNQKGIEKLVFCQGVTKEETRRFMLILAEKETPSESYGDYLKLKGVNNIEVDRIGTRAEHKKHDRGSRRDEKFFSGVSSSFSNILSGKSFDLMKLKLSMNGFLDNLTEQKTIFTEVGALKGHDAATFLHSINVSILSMFFSSSLGYAREDVLEVGVAALFHDIGKIAVAKQILTKPTTLTTEEFEEIKNHPHLGAKLLLKYRGVLGMLPVIVSFEHHLNFGGGGYPSFDFPVKPNIVSQIVAICDFYDALRSRRSYKKDFSPEELYEFMSKEKGRKFDPLLVDKFFQEIGVYPLGSRVKLSDNSLAAVINVNRQDIFRPMVRIIKPIVKKGQTVDLEYNKDISVLGTSEE